MLYTIILWTPSITLPYPVLNTIILWTSSITLPLPSVVHNYSLDKQYNSPLFPGLNTIILWTSSITLPLPCVEYNYSLDKQHYSPLTLGWIQSFSRQAVLLSPYPVLNTIILWTSSITLPLPWVKYNYSLDKQHYSPLTLRWIQSFSRQAVLLSPYPALNTIIL